MEHQYNFFQLVDKDAKIEADQSRFEVDVCPVCGDELIRNGRCKTCYSCGWSSCDI